MTARLITLSHRRGGRDTSPRKYSASRSGCCMELQGQNQISLTGFDVKQPLRIAALDASIGRAGSGLSVIRQRAARPNLQPLVARADHGMIRPEGRSRRGQQ